MKNKKLFLLSTALFLNLENAWAMQEADERAPRNQVLALQNSRATESNQEEDNKLFEFLQSAFNKIDADIVFQEHKIIIIGATGAGKSTLFNYLQHDLQYKYEQADAVVYQRKDGQRFVSKIKGGGQSETKLPVIGDQYDDCPGFEDTTSDKQSIINAYSIHQLLGKTSSAKILLAVKYSEFDSNRGKLFIKLIARLGCMFFNDIDQFTNSFGFVVTNISSYKTGKSVPTPKNEIIESVKKRLSLMIEDIPNLSEDIVKESERINTIKILTTLMDENKNNVEVFCRPDHTEVFQDVPNTERNSIETMLASRGAVQRVNPILVIDPAGKDRLKRFFSWSLVECHEAINSSFKEFDENIKEYIKSSRISAQDLRNHFAIVGQKIKIDSPENFENFIENLKKFHSETKEIFPQLYNFYKHLERFEFIKKLGISLNDQADVSYIRFSQKVNKSINKISRKFSLMGEYRSERMANRFRLSGGIIGTSDLYSEHVNLSHFSEIDIFSLHSLVLDEDVTAPEANLTFFSPNWFKKSNVKIDLSGKNGEKVIKESENGEGLPGNAGGPGGNFLGYYKNIFDEKSLTIISNGGNGSNGTNGAQGENGENGHTLKGGPIWLDEDEEKKYIFNTKVIRKFQGAVRGQKGGSGFSGGAEGLGGYKGIITFTSVVPNEITVTAHNGNDGKAGRPGEGGFGGLYPDLPEYFEEHDEIAFGKVKTPWRRSLAKVGMGIVSLGIVPLATGISALVNSYTNKDKCNIDEDKYNIKLNSPKAQSGDRGINSQLPVTPRTSNPINRQEKLLEYQHVR